MLPANETWLALANFTNGTLDGLWGNEWSPAGNASQPVNLTILPDNVGSVQFPTTDHQNYDLIFPLVRTVLSSEYYAGNVLCSIPVAGTYDPLTRTLFYLLLVFALLFRRHTWLATVALGTAMTYSAIVAVHVFALLTQFEWRRFTRANMQSSQQYGDLDIYSAYNVLAAALTMMPPILNWSTSLRRDPGQIIIVLWGLLLFAAWIPVQLYTSSTPSFKMFRPWSSNTINALLLCPISASQENPACHHGMNITRETYNMCQCFDFCGLIGPSTPMKSGAKMVPFLWSQSIIDLNNSETFWTIQYVTQAFAGAIGLYGLFGLLHNQLSLREMRNLVYRALNTHLRQTTTLWMKLFVRVFTRSSKGMDLEKIDSDSRTGLRRVQYIFARTVAFAFFLLGVLLAMACPLIFLLVIPINEITISWQPYSEGSDAVGAWGSWVAAIFAIGVAIILKYIEVWQLIFISTSKWLMEMILVDSLETRLAEKQQQKLEKDYFGDYVRKPMNHVRDSCKKALATMKFELHECKSWISNPGVHCQICGCDGCTLYRGWLLTTSAPADHVENPQCTCASCSLFGHNAKAISQRHKRLSNNCGCYCCDYTRIRSLGPDPRVTIKDRRTIGMGIVHIFDREIARMVERQPSAAIQATSTHGQVVPTASGSTTPAPVNEANNDTTNDAEAPLLLRGTPLR